MQLKREVTVSDIAAAITVICLIGGSYIALASRVSIQEVKTSSLETARIELKQDITERLDRIETKLDNVIKGK